MTTKQPLKLKLKLNLSRVLPSLQICRSKTALSNAIPPAPSSSACRLSPFSTTSLDINYPTLCNYNRDGPNRYPAPPPSTPRDECRCSKRHAAGRRCGSHPCLQCLLDRSFDLNSRECPPGKGADAKRPSTTPFCGASSYDDLLEVDDVSDEEETDALLFSSRSFSFDSSYEFNYPVITNKKNNDPDNKNNNNNNTKKVARHRRRVSRNLSGRCSTASFRVKGSVAVVKKSEDPYEDFKRSMWEMILEKQMFEAGDLEQLLQCFLSLNSRQYHGVIVEAFTEIWEILFCDSSRINTTR